MKIKNIFFDLDGTLTDPKQGVVASFQYALEKLNQNLRFFETMEDGHDD